MIATAHAFAPQPEAAGSAETEVIRLRTILCRIAREIDPCSDLGPDSAIEQFAKLPNDIRQQFRLLHQELAR